MFQHILTTLGQMDGEYQKKTVMLGTVKQRKEIEFSQSTGKSGQSFVLTAENGEESWVKWIGKDVEQGAMPIECVGNQYEWLVWPFKADQAPKPSLYCWLNKLVKPKEQNPQQAQQPAQQSQQPTSQAQQIAKAAIADKPVDWDAKELRGHRGHQVYNATLLVTKLAEIAGNTEGQSPGLIKEIAEELLQYIYNGPAARSATTDRPTQPSGPNPDYVGDNPQPVSEKEQIPF